MPSVPHIKPAFDVTEALMVKIMDKYDLMVQVYSTFTS